MSGSDARVYRLIPMDTQLAERITAAKLVCHVSLRERRGGKSGSVILGVEEVELIQNSVSTFVELCFVRDPALRCKQIQPRVPLVCLCISDGLVCRGRESKVCFPPRACFGVLVSETGIVVA